MAARRAAKTRKLATFCEKSCKNWTFVDGGQTAPSELAPRVGGTGDVLTGLLPPHSNKSTFYCAMSKAPFWMRTVSYTHLTLPTSDLV